MEVTVAIILPKESRSVGAVRRMCRSAMTETGADDESVDDMELAVAEACNNAVEHTGAFGYEAQIRANNHGCVINVLDTGPGYGGAPAPLPGPLQEHGRGVALMRELADRVTFDLREHRGTVVTLERRFASADQTLGEMVTVAEMPQQLRARVSAACGHPNRMLVRQRGSGGGRCVYDVFAATDDRLVVMELAERPDGSVFEETGTHTAAQIDAVERRGDWAAVSAATAAPRDPPVLVPTTVIEAVRGLS